MSLASRIARRERRRRVVRKIRDARSRVSVPRKPGRLLDWVPELSPQYRSPTHLRPIVDELERVREWVRVRRDYGVDQLAASDRVRLCASVPPGHWKSVTLHHFVAALLCEDQALKIGYGTYDFDFAALNVAEIRKLVVEAGVPLGDVDRAGEFHTAAGGCVVGFGLLAPPTGRRFHVVIVDDPYRSRQEAESAAIREKVVRGIRSDLLSRQVAGGSCFIIFHTRWHIEDAIGVLTKRKGKGAWTYINLPAIQENGAPLLPDVWTLDMLEEARAESEHDWWSLYMGEPRPPGGTLFFDAPALVEDFETDGAWVHVCGIDLARGEKQKNDPHAFALTRRAATDKSKTPTIDILDWLEEKGPIAEVDQLDEVTGRRVQKPGFLRHLERIAELYPGTVFVMYVGRTESSLVNLIAAATADKTSKRRGIKVHMLDSQGRTVWHRADSGYAQAWNHKRVRMRRRDPKTGKATTIHTGFVGGNAVDHFISGVTAAYDWHAGVRPKGFAGQGSGAPRTTGEGSEADRMGRYV